MFPDILNQNNTISHRSRMWVAPIVEIRASDLASSSGRRCQNIFGESGNKDLKVTHVIVSVRYPPLILSLDTFPTVFHVGGHVLPYATELLLLIALDNC